MGKEKLSLEEKYALLGSLKALALKLEEKGIVKFTYFDYTLWFSKDVGITYENGEYLYFEGNDFVRGTIDDVVNVVEEYLAEQKENN